MYYITAYATKIDLKNREMYTLLHAPLAKYKVDAEGHRHEQKNGHAAIRQ